MANGFVPNADGIVAGRKQVGGAVVAGWADQLDDMPIPDGFGRVRP